MRKWFIRLLVLITLCVLVYFGWSSFRGESAGNSLSAILVGMESRGELPVLKSSPDSLMATFLLSFMFGFVLFCGEALQGDSTIMMQYYNRYHYCPL